MMENTHNQLTLAARSVSSVAPSAVSKVKWCASASLTRGRPANSNVSQLHVISCMRHTRCHTGTSRFQALSVALVTAHADVSTWKYSVQPDVKPCQARFPTSHQ